MRRCGPAVDAAAAASPISPGWPLGEHAHSGAALPRSAETNAAAPAGDDDALQGRPARGCVTPLMTTKRAMRPEQWRTRPPGRQLTESLIAVRRRAAYFFSVWIMSPYGLVKMDSQVQKLPAPIGARGPANGS